MSTAISFEGLSKSYLVRTYGVGSLRGDARSLVRGLRRVGRQVNALDDVSFEIKQGEAVALMGANGAGKTTALRVMSRITKPSAGLARVNGRVGALIEVGAGIHLELSGRENIWLYGSILGIPRSEIRKRFDSVVDFAEIHQQLDTQAKFYSYGMQMRLAFSIASCLEPEILLVDESLSVGDANFQAKCLNRVQGLSAAGTTVVFVSHDVSILEQTCDRGILLQSGRVIDDGDIEGVLNRYLLAMAERRSVATGDDGARIVATSCVDDDGRPLPVVAKGQPLTVRIDVASPGDQTRLYLRVATPTADIIDCSMPAPLPGCTQEVSYLCRLDSLPLRPGLYLVRCRAWLRHNRSDRGGVSRDGIVPYS